MHPPDDLRLCTGCTVPHYENCMACFGFGYHATAGDPVTADEAMGNSPPLDGLPCMICRSTSKGPPLGAQVLVTVGEAGSCLPAFIRQRIRERIVEALDTPTNPPPP